VPSRLDAPPVGHRLTGKQVLAMASRIPKIRDTRRDHPGSFSRVFLKGPTRWQVSYYDKSGKNEIGQVLIDDPTASVVEAWTGFQVAWTMARGYRGAFGRKVDALYIWIPLLVLFVVPFVDPRRPLRMRHLDLLVLCAFSASIAFFNNGEIHASVPLVYPPLVYLLARLTWIAVRRSEERPREPLKLLVPASWMAVAVVFLLGFRIGLNLTNSNVIDVGYASVIGADRIGHGKPIYGTFPKDNPHGDTYGPVMYETYVPFELALPWSGKWDDVPAAHGAALVWDLLCAGGLWLLGRRIRGPTVGLALAYAWLAFPFTLFASNCNTNDALVALLLIVVLLVADRPALRGVFGALAGLTKFAPLALAPLLATHGGINRGRLARFAIGFAGAAFIAMLPVLLHGDLRAFWDRTLGFQLGRGAPFSVWGLYGGGVLDVLQKIVEVGAVLFAIAAAFLPRRPDVIGLAALGGAVLIALQLGVTYWFYLYIVWFLPFALVALLARDAEPAPAR
jgi:hypothetical protein